MAELLSIQERLYPSITCFGCGQANAKGLRLRSYPQEDGVVARFTPWPEHDNGFGYLNGGIIATLLDCHSGAAVFHEAEVRTLAPGAGEPLPPGAQLLYVTAGLDLRFLRPTPLREELALHAVVTSADADQMVVAVQLLWDAKPRAAATALWRRWHPRV